MDMFIAITDRTTKDVINLNVLSLKSYSSKDEVDRLGETHYLIIYSLFNNGFFEEEFLDSSSRDDKIAFLDNLKN